MTGHRDPWIECDGDGTCYPSQFPEDSGEQEFQCGTLRAVRAAAKAEGWRFTRDGRDLCPEHAEAGVNREQVPS